LKGKPVPFAEAIFTTTGRSLKLDHELLSCDSENFAYIPVLRRSGQEFVKKISQKWRFRTKKNFRSNENRLVRTKFFIATRADKNTRVYVGHGDEDEHGTRLRIS
jgi:hypothetical protein